jgi:stage II sporulation protein M
MFQTRFTGGAASIVEWYRRELPGTVGRLRGSLVIVITLALVSIVISYVWVVTNVPVYVDLTPDRIDRIKTMVAGNLTDLDIARDVLPAPVLFYHNVRATVAIFLLGLVSFGTLGLTLFMVNMVLVGGVLGGASLVGFSPWLIFAAGVLPHGLFELTAVILATAAMLKAGAQLVTPQPDKSLGEVLILSLADWSRVFIGLVLPLLVIAAIVEIYLTPVLIKLAFPFL